MTTPPVTTPPVNVPPVAPPVAPPDQVPQVPGVQRRTSGRGPGGQQEPVRPDRDPADYDIEDVLPAQ